MTWQGKCLQGEDGTTSRVGGYVMLRMNSKKAAVIIVSIVITIGFVAAILVCIPNVNTGDVTTTLPNKWVFPCIDPIFNLTQIFPTKLTRLWFSSNYDVEGSHKMEPESGGEETIKMGEASHCYVTEDSYLNLSCDWWVMEGLTPLYSLKKPRKYMECVGMRAPAEAEETAVMLGHMGGDNQSEAVILSPVLEGTTMGIIVRFWILINCPDALVQVFVMSWSSKGDIRINSSCDIIINQTMEWIEVVQLVQVSTLFDRHRVGIIGIVTSSHNCSHPCMTSSRQQVDEGVALNKIHAELIYPQCNAGRQKSNLSCSFHTRSANTSHSTTCDWSLHNDDMIEHMDDISDYHDIPPSDHGLVIYFDAARVEQKFEVSTPWLLPPNSCSCLIHFKYLFTDEMQPRVSVRLYHKDDQHRNHRLIIWSSRRGRHNMWHEARVPINLLRGDQFKIVIEVDEKEDSRQTVLVDDVTMDNCDLQILD
uniref:uncharacterized protein LOC100186630 isoform X3 n=1 Tax=Ciona intestinalis TaxID=7719 RepID=UPI0002B8EA5C|nr:uncharacterized protein LOC100186630 isoform X3 [Ciona intestinalis]|eukprot:XP_026694440.1 uncharacterized protein LOC100186630 isoform X3 [Ciona intestinalis]